MVFITVTGVDPVEGAKGKFSVKVSLSDGTHEERKEFLVFRYFCRDLPDAGESLSEERYEAIWSADESSRAAIQAVTFLAYRDRTARELEGKLREKNYSKEACAAAVRFAVEKRYIREDEQLERMMHQLCEVKRYGIRRIRQEVYARRFDRDTVSAHFDRIAEELDFEEALAERIRALPDGALEGERRKKTVSSLLRYGFSYEEIQRELKRKDRNNGT